MPSVMDTVEGGGEDEPLYQGGWVVAGIHGSNVLTGYQGLITEAVCARWWLLDGCTVSYCLIEKWILPCLSGAGRECPDFQLCNARLADDIEGDMGSGLFAAPDLGDDDSVTRPADGESSLWPDR